MAADPGCWLAVEIAGENSTFCFYTDEEFEGALREFRKAIERNYNDLSAIRYVGENILIVARKEGSLSAGASAARPSSQARARRQQSLFPSSFKE